LGIIGPPNTAYPEIQRGSAALHTHTLQPREGPPGQAANRQVAFRIAMFRKQRN